MSTFPWEIYQKRQGRVAMLGVSSSLGQDAPLETCSSMAQSFPAQLARGLVRSTIWWEKMENVLCRSSCVQLLSLELERAPLQHVAAAKPSSDRQPVGQCAVLRALGNAASTLLQREKKKCPSSFCSCWQKTFLSVHPKNSIL